MDLDHATGGTVDGWAHVVQSVQTILGTRLNTRVFRRAFGSDVATMVDAPMNDAGVLALIVAVAEAIETWEPRFDLTDVQLDGTAQGRITLVLSGTYLPNAHMGDLSTVSDELRQVRVAAGRADAWSLSP